MNDPTIISDPGILGGKPVVAGTRVSVELILEKIASGESIDQILQSHPRLTRDAVSAAIRYAAKSVHGPKQPACIANAAKADRASDVIRDRASDLAAAFSVITPRAVRIRR